MRYFVVIYILITCFNPAFCQKYYTETGITKFDGSRAAFEPIKAMNSKTISLIDLKTAEIAALIYINQFEFRLGLMQEHFNENYLESNTYPKSTFNGKIINLNNDDISEKPVKYEIIGNLEIKGVTKKINTIAVIKKIKDQIHIKSDFSVMLSDYGVKIPKIVFKKIDEEVKINLNFIYDKKQN